MNEIENLVKDGVVVNFILHEKTPLYVASRNGKSIEFEITEIICDENLKSLQFKGHADVVELLANHGADLCLRSLARYDPLLIAIENGKLLYMINVPLEEKSYFRFRK